MAAAVRCYLVLGKAGWRLMTYDLDAVVVVHGVWCW